MKKVKCKKPIILLLLLVEIISIFLTYKSGNSKFAKEEIKMENSIFAIMLEDGLETKKYVESNENKWPGYGYRYNEELSKCVDSNGNLIEEIMSFDNETRVATVKTKTEAYCYLYFDVDPLPNIENMTFYIKENITPKYTKAKTNSIYLSWTEEDIKSYCITEDEDYKNCEWKDSNGRQSIEEETYTFQNDTNELKKVYAYIKDGAGGVGTKADKIYYDNTLPILKDLTITGNAGNSGYARTNLATLRFTWEDEDIDEYCIVTSNNSNGCVWVKTNGVNVISILNHLLEGNDGTKVYYVFIKDKAGNISNSKNTSIILDRVVPTCNITGSLVNEGVDGINVTFDCIDATSGCLTVKSTISNVKTTQTKEISDKAGNKATCTAPVTLVWQKNTGSCTGGHTYCNYGGKVCPAGKTGKIYQCKKSGTLYDTACVASKPAAGCTVKNSSCCLVAKVDTWNTGDNCPCLGYGNWTGWQNITDSCTESSTTTLQTKCRQVYKLAS